MPLPTVAGNITATRWGVAISFQMADGKMFNNAPGKAAVRKK